MKFLKLFNEMANIHKNRNKLTINGIPLNKVSIEELNNNIIYYRVDKEIILKPIGFTMVWFIKDDETVEKIINNYDLLLFFPNRPVFDFNSNPINDIWKKNNNTQKGIIGALEAITNDDYIFINMMSVRNGYMKNGINRFMIQTLTEKFPNALLKFSIPTKQGKEFIKKYYPNAKIEGIILDDDIEGYIQDIKNNTNKFAITDIDVINLGKIFLKEKLPNRNDFNKEYQYADAIIKLIKGL